MDDPRVPEPGEKVVVVQTRLTDYAIQADGVIAMCSPAAVAVQFPRAVDWPKDTEVLLVIGAGAERQVAPGRLALSKDRVIAFRMLGEWRRVNLRSSKRFNTDLRADVRSTLGGSKQQGTIVDVSTGGMAIEVPRKPGGTEVEVSVQADGFSASLPCEVVDSREGAEWTLLHLRFRELNVIQQVFVRNLIASLEAQERSRAS